MKTLCVSQARSCNLKLVEELWQTSVKEDVDLALKHHLRARESPEAREGIAAFNENRPPQWIK